MIKKTKVKDIRMATYTLATLSITKGLDQDNKHKKMAQCTTVNGSKIKKYMELRFTLAETFTQANSKMGNIMDEERIQKLMALSTKEISKTDRSMAKESSQMMMAHTKQVNFKMTNCFMEQF